jgi:succinate dehydrogenase / fumarate reductase cytochrome b subunit
MNMQRFSNFNLLTIQYPFTALISILHRLSGIFVFLLIPFILWFLQVALSNEPAFHNLQATLSGPLYKMTLWLFLVALGFHLVAGIRHLVMDAGFGETLAHARLSGAVSLGISVIWALFIGIWLW